MTEELRFIEALVSKSGPERSDYTALDEWFRTIHARAKSGELSPLDRRSLREVFGEAMSPSTLQGFVCDRPHGYAGDFEIINKIYVTHISPNPRLARWDAYFHAQSATKAVRNRKAYFHSLLNRHYARRRPLRVLKLASGPGRSMFEWLSIHPDAEVTFHCVEMDSTAIAYAAALNAEFSSQITFEQQNVITFRPAVEYDLIWAAGLFDYFSDRVFRSVIRRLVPAIADGGELVIGNFCPTNRSRAYMEFGGWELRHRSAEALVLLAHGCGVRADAVHIGAEPEGVNLFLHMTS